MGNFITLASEHRKAIIPPDMTEACIYMGHDNKHRLYLLLLQPIHPHTRGNDAFLIFYKVQRYLVFQIKGTIYLYPVYTSRHESYPFSMVGSDIPNINGPYKHTTFYTNREFCGEECNSEDCKDCVTKTRYIEDEDLKGMPEYFIPSVSCKYLQIHVATYRELLNKTVFEYTCSKTNNLILDMGDKDTPMGDDIDISRLIPLQELQVQSCKGCKGAIRLNGVDCLCCFRSATVWELRKDSNKGAGCTWRENDFEDFVYNAREIGGAVGRIAITTVTIIAAVIAVSAVCSSFLGWLF